MGTPRKKLLDDETHEIPHVPPLTLDATPLTAPTISSNPVKIVTEQLSSHVQTVIVDKQSEQPGKKRRQSGWTRQRRSRAIAKLKQMEEAGDGALQQEAVSPSNEHESFKSPRSQ